MYDVVLRGQIIKVVGLLCLVNTQHLGARKKP